MTLERDLRHRRHAAFVRTPLFEDTAARKRELDDVDSGARDVSVATYVEGMAVPYFDGRDAITRITGIKGQVLTQLLDIEVARQRGLEQRAALGITDGLEHGTH